ncbi:unnamed protein product [Caenorhabditis brenneri]
MGNTIAKITQQNCQNKAEMDQLKRDSSPSPTTSAQPPGVPAPAASRSPTPDRNIFQSGSSILESSIIWPSVHPVYGTKVESVTAQDTFFRKLRGSRPGSFPFMNIFVQEWKAGAHNHFQNNQVPMNFHLDGRNFMEDIGDLTEIHVFKSMDGLGMKLPSDLSLKTIPAYLDPNQEIGVNDSETMERNDKELGEFLGEYVKDISMRPTILNNLTTQFYNQKLDKFFKLPSYVADRSMLEELKNALNVQKESDFTKKLLSLMPNYEKFLFLSLEGCFTDGHVDFAGSSVYNYILKASSKSGGAKMPSLGSRRRCLALFQGQKVFFFARPTKTNLDVYKRHKLENSEIWIGEVLAGEWRYVVLDEKDTIFIPAGYIHFVWTPIDSVMIGGNFLMDSELEMQFDIQKFEEDDYKKELKKGAEKNDSHLFQGFKPFMWGYVEFVLLPKLQNFKDAANLDHLLFMASVFLKELNPNVTAQPYNPTEKKVIIERLEEVVLKIENDKRKRGSDGGENMPLVPIKRIKLSEN